MSGTGIFIATFISYLQVIEDFLPELKNPKRLYLFLGIGTFVYGFLFSVGFVSIIIGSIIGAILGIRHNLTIETMDKKAAQITPSFSVTIDDYIKDADRTYFCPNCGNSLKSEDKFCSSCGEKIDPEIFQRKKLN